MRATLRLFQQAAKVAQAGELPIRITYFTRDGCQLCVNAKETLGKVWDIKPFVYREINVMKDVDQKVWKDLYEWDTPVIHVAKSTASEEDPELSGKAKKLMHRFTTEEVIKKMEEVESAN